MQQLEGFFLRNVFYLGNVPCQLNGLQRELSTLFILLLTKPGLFCQPTAIFAQAQLVANLLIFGRTKKKKVGVFTHCQSMEATKV